MRYSDGVISAKCARLNSDARGRKARWLNSVKLVRFCFNLFYEPREWWISRGQRWKKSNISELNFLALGPPTRIDRRATRDAAQSIRARDRVDCVCLAGPRLYFNQFTDCSRKQDAFPLNASARANLIKNTAENPARGETRFGATNFIASVFRREDED